MTKTQTKSKTPSRRKPDAQPEPPPTVEAVSLPAPALLVSWVYLRSFLNARERIHHRDWVLDSGAYSAMNSGTKIDLQEYTEAAKRMVAEDPTLTEVFALDVIGDWRASLKNCEAMWAAGVPAIPCYHLGEPEDVLRTIARDYPKIALGGAVGATGKQKWAEQCFARVWPKRIHGFGFGSRQTILALPWHSVDASNWEIGPTKYGRWRTFGKMSVRGGKQNLQCEIDWYLSLERLAQHRWRKQMAQLDTLGPTIRLVHNDSNRMTQATGPTVRLSMAHARMGRPSVRLAWWTGAPSRMN